MSIPLVISVVGDVSKLGGSLGAAGKEVDVFGKKIDAGGIAKMALLAGGVGIVVNVLGDLATAAATDRDEANKLATAITAAGAATGAWQADVESAIVAGQALAFSDTEIRNALEQLVPVMGGVAASTDALALAQDVARLKGISLEQATAAVAKAQGGQATALSKLLGINAKGLTSTEVLAEAQRRAAGQATTYGKSTAGAAERNGIAMAEMGEKIGALLLPVLDALIPAIIPIIDAFSEIMDAILPVLIPYFQLLGKVLGIVGKVIATIARAIAGFVKGLADAIGTVVDFIASLGPVKALGDLLGNIFGPGLAPAMAGVTGGAAMGPGASTTFGPIYVTGADPDAVVRALRRWASLNGGRPALERRIDHG